MNRKIHLLSLLLLFTGTFTVTSCSDDDSSQTELIDTSNINSFNIIKKSSILCVEEPLCSCDLSILLILPGLGLLFTTDKAGAKNS